MSVTWWQIRESLQRFDRVVILQAVQQLLDAELPLEMFDSRPRDLPYATPKIWQSLIKKLYPLLTQTVGSWYGVGGLGVGDEILSSWCWCHSFPASLEAPDRTQQIQQGATVIVEQIELRRNFLLELSKLFASLPFSADLNQQEAQMQVATVAIVNFIVLETRCNESWYNYVTSAIAWFLESKEVFVSETLQSYIDQTVELSFNSWVAPSGQTKQSVSEAIAFELFKQEFERQYPL